MKTGINVVSKVTNLDADLMDKYRPFCEVIRFPGGDSTNSWDAIKGVDKTNPKNWHTKFNHTALKKFKDDTGASVVILGVNLFDTNEEIIESLTDAENKGIKVTHIELGNEIYFDKWDMSPQQYVEKVQTLIPLLRVKFRGVKIAALAIAKNGNTTKQNTWNTLVKELDTIVDNWTIHIYVPKGWSVQKRLTKMATPLSKLDTGRPFWITEVGTKNDDAQLIELMEAIKTESIKVDFMTVYCLMNFTEPYSMVDRYSTEITARGELVKNWMASPVSLFGRVANWFRSLLR
jgi:hypothetical protein